MKEKKMKRGRRPARRRGSNVERDGRRRRRRRRYLRLAGKCLLDLGGHCDSQVDMSSVSIKWQNPSEGLMKGTEKSICCVLL